MITGLSGSGKSSLAFDTIYAEGQRRYVESLSAYARQFLGQMDKPDVDSIEGLSPAISIDQKTTSRNPRSTVGTVTEIYDYLRLLWARIGHPHCHICGRPITGQSAEQIIDQVMELPEGTRFMVLAPIVRGRKGEYGKQLEELRAEGFTRAKIDGELRRLDEEIALDKKYKHDIAIVVDRLVMKGELRKRLADSIETAVALADGLVEIELVDTRSSIQTYSERFACPVHGPSLVELEPRIFSFNSPHGACPRCTGLGSQMEIDPELVVPDPTLSIGEGAIAPWAASASDYYDQLIQAIAERYEVDLETPWEDLPAGRGTSSCTGPTATACRSTYRNRFGRRRSYATTFDGIIPNLERRYRETESEFAREKIEEYMTLRPCPDCKGARLRPESRAVLVAGTRDPRVHARCRRGERSSGSTSSSSQSTTSGSRGWCCARSRSACGSSRTSASAICRWIARRRRCPAARPSGSGWPRRSARRWSASCTSLTSRRSDCTSATTSKLIVTLERLRDLGNTVLVVEHDEGTMRAADHLVDMGPGAGEHGGHVVAEGTAEEVEKVAESLTGQFLAGTRRIEVPAQAAQAERVHRRSRAPPSTTSEHRREDPARRAVLRDRRVGLGQVDAGQRGALQGGRQPAAPDRGSEPARTGGSPGSTSSTRSSRSTSRRSGARRARTRRPTSGCSTRSASCSPRPRRRGPAGYKPGRFSFNVKGGRCEVCRGDGQIKIEMHFLPDVYVPCEQCHGKRYNRETLEVRFKGKTIADVLEMPIEEALEFFAHIPKIRRRVEALNDVGLGYMRLGQPATTLSGGEAQRVKLAAELSKVATGRTLYILDEPTTGLHFADIQRLLEVLSAWSTPATRSW